jgi:two-component system NtrC family response regulator
MQEVFATVLKVADSDATILITGDSGTGKELIAKAIHQHSERSKHPMVTVNCAAIPKELLESELFGHVEGAFTGAIKDKTGKFVLADRGTIFLDEIGDMNLELQAKLLRVLEDKSVEPVGSENSIAVDIRVLAATNQDLLTLVRNNKFREDLFYRLNVIPMTMPPLRERVEDIPLLVHHFLEKFSGKSSPSIDKKTLDILVEYEWPGNVRELENVMKRIVILIKGKRIKVSDLPDEIAGRGKQRSEQKKRSGPEGEATLMESEKKMIIDALDRSGWNQTRAAKRLGIARHVLIYRIKKHNIKESDSNQSPL